MESKFEQLVSEMRNLGYLGSAISMIQWDQQVNMPGGAVNHRANQLSFMESMYHEMHTGKSFSRILGEFIDLKSGNLLDNSLTELEKTMIYEAWRDYKDATSLPVEFVEEYSRTQSQSFSAWEKAKQTGNFSDFAPYLEKMINMSKEKAKLLNPNVSTYDSLIDTFEPYMTSEKYDKLFSDLKVKISDLIHKINGTNKKNYDIKNYTWEVEAQNKFINMVLHDLKYDWNCGRIDSSEHPFSTSFHPTDCRITTKYKLNDAMFGILASIHECGHALYEQGLDKKWYGTPLGSSSSMGVHESQSRFYETRIGQSKSFWEYYFPILKSHFFENLKEVSCSEFYKSLNKVESGPIRLEADELSYNLHIIIRYEMEKLIIGTDISVTELPKIWNSKYQEYLGVTPQNDREGILQDVHWSEGYFGYFPSYVLGSIYASQLYEKMLTSIPDMEDKIRNGIFGPIREWLRENIHSKGRAMKPQELIEMATGKPLTIEPYMNYLTKKYSEIYFG